MAKCVFIVTDDECSVYHGADADRPSECDRHGICICVDKGNFEDCDSSSDTMPEM